ncbi:NAD(P)-binding protein [Spirosoma taeanense]|uniref:NAD(P)-binding protein n=1 Tax=Spirosoma taeanense TaxID=2735870 RepID=A0A6M5Y7H8_9BACT|nr:FAD-dependent oxidoreductase [Spirosoma taeanense]QJW89191.1 NAD(P)-binding protein [Spirosoma taeanense]
MPSALIIGAGMAGLTAARELTRYGWDVVVLDKGRGVGGRMATRRIEPASSQTMPAGLIRADHGASYFPVRTPEFRQVVAQLIEAHVVKEWHLETAQVADVSVEGPYYTGVEGMSAVPKYLARNLTIQTNQKVIRITSEAAGWLVETESGESYRAEALISTLPAPQALMLLQQSSFNLSAADQTALSGIRYQPCLAVIAALSEPSRIPAPGAVRHPTDDVAWVADNQQKGISSNPSVTVHASAAFSQRHLEDADLNAVGRQLLNQLDEWIPANAVATIQVHRWRYSLADERYPAPFLNAQAPFPLVFGGDGFGAGGVEGAFMSGLRLAEFLQQNRR